MAPAARRVGRTADALAGVLSAHARPSVIFFKTLDTILVALGEPYGLRVASQRNPGIQFETLPPGLTTAGPTVEFACGLDFVVLRPRRAGEDERARKLALVGASDFVAELAKTLANAEAHHISDLCGTLLAGLETAVNSHSAQAPANRTDTKVASGSIEQIKDFFDQIDAFLCCQDYRFHLRFTPVGAKPCPRFFFFYRIMGYAGEPNIRLFLFESQRRCLRKLLTDGATNLGDADRLQANLEEAFDAKYWGIENNFRTGVTSWVDWPWMHRRADEGPPSLVFAETAVNTLATGRADFVPNSEKGAAGSSTLVVPIHVNGLPWLAFATILPEKDPDARVWAQYLYRDLLPYLTTTVRKFAQKVYLQEVRSRAVQALKTGKDSLRELNETLGSLTATFPYPEVALSNTGSEKLVWRGSPVYLTTSPNTRLGFQTSPVTYTLLSPSDVVAELNSAQVEVVAAQAKLLEERISSYENIAHTLKTLVSSMGWETAAGEVAKVSRNFAELQRQGLHEQALNRISNALCFADRSLSLFWTVEGLAHFIRLAGARSGKFEWRKFLEWLQDEKRTEQQIIVQKAYANSIFLLGQSLCFGWNWRSLTVTLPSVGEKYDWSGEDPAAFSVKNLHFPPFRKGSEGAYVFVFCLAEPIVNAIRALHDLPTGIVPASSRVLRVSVQGGSDVPDEVVVTVTNVSRRSLPERLSGWESTKHMLRDLGLGRFDPAPEVMRLENGLFEVTSTVRFYPSMLAKIIRQGAEKQDGYGATATAASPDR